MGHKIVSKGVNEHSWFGQTKRKKVERMESVLKGAFTMFLFTMLIVVPFVLSL